MTSRRRQPPTAPPDLWARPEMSRALADRDMGTVVRIFRRWTGASQTHIRSSWQGKRLTRIREILAGPEYRHSAAARDVKDRIDEFEASPSIVSRDLGSDQAGKGQH
jgi:hypothetical protein